MSRGRLDACLSDLNGPLMRYSLEKCFVNCDELSSLSTKPDGFDFNYQPQVRLHSVIETSLSVISFRRRQRAVNTQSIKQTKRPRAIWLSTNKSKVLECGTTCQPRPISRKVFLFFRHWRHSRRMRAGNLRFLLGASTAAHTRDFEASSCTYKQVERKQRAKFPCLPRKCYSHSF